MLDTRLDTGYYYQLAYMSSAKATTDAITAFAQCVKAPSPQDNIQAPAEPSVGANAATAEDNTQITLTTGEGSDAVHPTPATKYRETYHPSCLHRLPPPPDLFLFLPLLLEVGAFSPTLLAELDP